MSVYTQRERETEREKKKKRWHTFHVVKLFRSTSSPSISPLFFSSSPSIIFNFPPLFTSTPIISSPSHSLSLNRFKFFLSEKKPYIYINIYIRTRTHAYIYICISTCSNHHRTTSINLENTPQTHQ